MPWCPECKNEYVEGITTCADCGVELVEKLPEEKLADEPVVLGHVSTEEMGEKIVTYLNYSGIQTAILLSSKAENEGAGFDVIVAPFEKVDAEMIFDSLGDKTESDEATFESLMPKIEEKLSEIEEEEATKMFSDLRTETSSVYVKKKDKYNDLKFSGISFIVFGLIGAIILSLNMAGVFEFFNTFSSIILFVVFIGFFGIGIGSLIRAKKIKGLVAQEDRANDEVMDWIEKNMDDEWIETLMNPENSEEDNYFDVHSRMCKQLSEAFPFLNADYIDQLMDDRYHQYCETRD